MNIRLSSLLTLLRAAKNRFVADDLDYHIIKFGIAAGMQMLVNRRGNLRLELGFYEIGVARHFLHLAKGVAVGYDIGSAMGYYVLAMCKQGVQSIVAFEPDPQRVLYLQETLRRNNIRDDRVQILSCFVSDKSEGKECRIDDLVTTSRIRPPNFVKMDIDGAEIQALLGMRHTVLTYHPAFIIEVHSAALEQGCMQFLRTAGYDQIHVVDNGPLINHFMPEGRPIELNRWVVAWRSMHIGHC